MNSSQRQAAFERLLTALARRRADRLRMGYAGTIRRIAPPPLPGQKAGSTLYFVNATSARGGGPSLVGFDRESAAILSRAEKWVESGKGAAPAVPGRAKRVKTVKT